MKLAYAANPDRSMVANLIHVWDRADIPAPKMSVSSGPKDYTRNHIFTVFDRYPWAARVLMVRGLYSSIGSEGKPSPMFLLIEDAAGTTFDIGLEEVLVQL